MNTKSLLCSLLLCTALAGARAQGFALKTNLVYDATLTANLGCEFPIARRWTIDLSANLNAWQMPSDILLKHAMAQPEFRYWFCDKFAGHFFALHALAGIMNVGHFGNDPTYLGYTLENTGELRAEGWFLGAGVAYGYDWVLSKHWNLEFELGIGYAHFTYDLKCYDCHYGECSYCAPACLNDGDCKGVHSQDNHFNYLGLTKLALNLVYLF